MDVKDFGDGFTANEEIAKVKIESMDDLPSIARGFFVSQAAAFGLDASRIEVRYVLNQGGFVNTSVQVRDGRAALHVKLASTEEGREALRRWHRLDALLRRHRAPPVLAWIDVGTAAGLVFPLLEGVVPPPSAEVTRGLLNELQGLWGDEALAEELGDGRAPTAADVYLGTYHDRFSADLDAIEADPPPFVRGADLSWMQDEATRLEALVRGSPAFAETMTTPIHGDLWLNNVLWEPGGAWWLLDWDDLQVGDPALDVATLTGPTADDLRPLKHLDQIDAVLKGRARDRLDVLARASLLDWVIDPLADWIEAATAPIDLVAVRAEKERVHRGALALYRELYG